MSKTRMKKQSNKICDMCTIGIFSLGGTEWVALLAARGFSPVEIRILETIFYITSLAFEIPPRGILGKKQ